jgi:alpha-2-macroglobulin
LLITLTAITLSACATRIRPQQSVASSTAAPAQQITALFSPLKAEAQSTTTRSPGPSPTPQPTWTPYPTASPSPLTQIATFGEGANLQLVDAGGERRVQFVLSSYGGDRRSTALYSAVTFELYRVPDALAVTRVISDFQVDWTYGDRNAWAPSLTGLEDTRVWRIEPGDGPTPTLSGSYDVDHGRTEAYETRIPADVGPGVYLLAISMPDQTAKRYLHVVIAPHVITVKHSPTQIVSRVSDFAGKPIPGARVRVISKTGELIAEGDCDANGGMRIDIPRSANPAFAVATHNGAVSLSGIDGSWRNYGNYDNFDWFLPAPKTNGVTAALYTDRPIYKPGQTVNFKGILRRDDDTAYSVPEAGFTTTVRILDGRENVVRSDDIGVNEFGSISGSLRIADGATLGVWSIEAVNDGEAATAFFEVQAYRKPEIEVSVSTNVSRMVSGDQVTVTVHGDYLLGQPARGAKVSLSTYGVYESWCKTTRAYNRWCTSDYYWTLGTSDVMKGSLDANGYFTTTLILSTKGAGYWSGFDYSMPYGIEATVDDGSAQTVSNFGIVEVNPAAERIVLDQTWRDSVQRAGQPITISGQILDLAGQPVVGRDITLSGNLSVFAQSQGYKQNELSSLRGVSGSDGRFSFAVSIDTAGSLGLVLRAVDTRANDYSAQHYIWAVAADEAQNLNLDVKISADRAAYEIGDTAELVIQSPISGPAWLTIERGKVRRDRQIQLESPLTRVQLPIEPGDAPNIFARINVVDPRQATLDQIRARDYDRRAQYDARLWHAAVELAVAPVGKQLTVTLIADKAVYAPREKARYQVRVTDAQGAPVTAEMSIALVDEAIFALTTDKNRSLFDTFYTRRNNSVNTYDALSLQRWLYSNGRGGGGGGGAGANNPRVNFPDTALWLPAVTTDANGEAVIEVDLPDSLTTWRITARAVDAQTRVGEAQLKVLATQSTVVRPLLPAALVEGDSTLLSVQVSNYATRTREIEVGLSVSETLLIMTDAPTRVITLAEGETRIVGWQVTAKAAGDATLLATARPLSVLDGEDIGDAVRVSLPVHALAVTDLRVNTGEIRAQSAELTVDMPSDANETSVVEIELNRSIASVMLSGLDYLTGYPYGCVEQTMSRALPNAVVARTAKQLGLNNGDLAKDLDDKLAESVQRLYGLQHNDGGWGWWYDDQTDEYQTAWVLFGLSTMRDAGAQVDPAVISRGALWLEQRLPIGQDANTRAFSLYSLALSGNAHVTATRQLAGGRDFAKMDGFGLSALALAQDIGGERAGALETFAALQKLAFLDAAGDGAFVSGKSQDETYHRKSMASTTRSTAFALAVYARLAPGNEMEARFVRYLMRNRGAHGWGATNETAFAILGLTDHLRRIAATPDTSTIALALNGAPVASRTLGELRAREIITLTRAQLAAGANTIRLTQTGGAAAYYTLRARLLLPRRQIDAAGPIRIERRYSDRAGVALSDAAMRALKIGDLVQVTLVLTSEKPLSYVMLQDTLPAGLEAINERLNTSGHAGLNVEERFDYGHWGYNYKEIRANRVGFFFTEIDDRLRVTYLARVTRGGAFVAMPAEAEAMYDVETWGRSASATFEAVR